MKRALLFLSVLCLAATIASAQEKKTSTASDTTTASKKRTSGAFGKKFHSWSFGYGFQTQFPDKLELRTIFGENIPFTETSHSGVGPLSVRFERAIGTSFGVASTLQYSSETIQGYTYDRNYNKNSSSENGVSFGLTGVLFYHCNRLIPVRNLDIYFGVGAGIAYDQWKSDSDGVLGSTSASAPVASFIALIGARYYVSKGFGIFFEGGTTGYSPYNAGITLK